MTPVKTASSGRRKQDPTPLRPLNLLGRADMEEQAEDAPFSVWDGDDMTLEMITEVDDGDMDEEVRVLPLL